MRSSKRASSRAIAEYVRDELARAGLDLRERADGLPAVRMPPIGERQLRPFADSDRIAEDPAYGEIVCFCERVSRGELRDAAQSPVPAVDLDGLRRRTRALMGRCQGFFCGVEVARALANETGGDMLGLWEPA